MSFLVPDKKRSLPTLYAKICVLLLLFSQHFAGSGAPFDLRYLGIGQGLSNNSVRCIFQDHNGFMWFGTYDGLNRYDGYSFKIFRNKPNDSASIPHNYINTIGEDHHGNLFVGTGQGVSIYNSLSSSFRTGMYIPFGGRQQQRIPFNIDAITTDKGGNLYMATSGGGLLVVPDGKDVAIQVDCPKDASGNCYNLARSLVIDKQQRVWVAITDAGLFLYHPDTKKLELVNSTPRAVRCMAADDGENLWIGSFDGLYRYHIPSKTLNRPFDTAPGKLTSNSIFSLAFDREHELWIGTEGGGINLSNTVTNSLGYLLPGDTKNALSSETVYVIYEDAESRKWIGTHKGGLSIIDPQKRKFQTIRHDPLNANSLANNFISSFYNDGQGNIWIGSDGGGISIWNRKTNVFTNYRHRAGDPQSLSHDAVPYMLRDYLGDTWIATFGGGINKFNKTGTFKHYPCINDQNGLENKYVWRLYEDAAHNLWATTYADGRLYRLNRETDRFEVFCQEPADLFCLMEDATNTLWGGSVYGLCRVDKVARKFIEYTIPKPVRAIMEDKKGRLWVGTEGLGLILFDRIKGRIEKIYSDADGLCNNSVLNILEDGKGYLWLSTFHGLSRFDPATGTFKNYYQEDGLQSNQFEYNAALRLQSGEMVFGGISGFTIFHPDSLQFRSNTPPVFLTGLRINNQPVTSSSSYVTRSDSNSLRQLTIPYDDAVLSFDFSALEYSLPEKISYAYWLEGWDKGWNYTGTLRTANYTRLKEGTYQLHIKATNAAGAWNPQEVKLTVKVLPPWFRTWWAYLFYTALVISLLYIYISYRNRQNRLQYEVKLLHLETEKEKELAHLEIQKEKELAQLEIHKEKELNEKKLEFFTDVSHEFRTPLTLIINPAKDLLQKEGQSHNHHLNTIYRNARRLIGMVDQLLLFRKADAEGARLKVSRFDYSLLCREVYLNFSQEAQTRGIQYQFTCPDHLYIYADYQRAEIALYNLLSNAIKYTPNQGTVHFEVSENDSEIIATIKDSGPGIPAGTGDQVFNKFYQAVDKNSTTKSGFGIGLYLVKSFAQSHSGSVSYVSQPGNGTSFILSLLKGKDHFDPQTISEIGPEQDHGLAKPLAAEKPATAELPKVADLLDPDITLLVVEDDDQLREYIASIFTDKYKVLQANCAEDGLALAREHLPDLIITDLIMKEMNGMQLCESIKKDAALGHIPVIMLTGSLSPESRLKGIEHGADDYLTKPFEKDLLVARVANLLKNRTILQNYFYNEITLQKSDLKISEEYKIFLESCIAIVEAHLDDENFSIKALAAEVGMSHSKLYRKVKSISGLSVNAFIRFIRLRKAAALFVTTNMNVNETAFEVGITNVKYFREQFNKLFGVNPSEYIRKYRKAFGTNYRVNKDAFGEDPET
ncbi:MAG: two-component regulator propeller domain-containing protein [Bacteroidota bacterium]